MKLRLSRGAEDDLEEAWTFTARRWAPEQADNLLDEIEGAFRLLLRFPGLGRLRDELSPGLRSFPVSGFVVFYRGSEGLLDVVRVLHGARDASALFERDPET